MINDFALMKERQEETIFTIDCNVRKFKVCQHSFGRENAVFEVNVTKMS